MRVYAREKKKWRNELTVIMPDGMTTDNLAVCQMKVNG